MRIVAALGGNALPGRQVACLVSRTLVSRDDPAFARPSKFVGPVYDEQRARALAAPAELRARSFPAGSMGPKIEAVCRFVEATGSPPPSAD